MIVRSLLLAGVGLWLACGPVFAQPAPQEEGPVLTTDFSGFQDQAPLPDTGLLHNTRTGSSLAYACAPSQDTKMLECAFVENMIRKDAQLSDWDPAKLKADPLMPEIRKSLERECEPKRLAGVLDVIRDKRKPETPDEQAVAFSVREFNAAEREQHARTVKKLCKTRDVAAAGRAAFEMAAKTCKMVQYPFRLSFPIPAREGEAMTSKPEPDYACGMSVSAVFHQAEKPGETIAPAPWILTLKRAPDPKQVQMTPFTPAGKCKDRSAAETVYAADPAPKTRYQCEFIQLSAP